MRNEALTYVKKFQVSIKEFGQKILGVTEARYLELLKLGVTELLLC